MAYVVSDLQNMNCEVVSELQNTSQEKFIIEKVIKKRW